jgi:hypothetical protein
MNFVFPPGEAAKQKSLNDIYLNPLAPLLLEDDSSVFESQTQAERHPPKSRPDAG